MGLVTSDLPAFVAVYALFYSAFGVQSPFIPTLLGERGLSASEIGTVLAASTAIRIWAGPAGGHMADRTRKHAAILCACAVAAAIAGLGYVALRGVGDLLLVALINAAMLAPVVPVSDALAIAAAQDSEHDKSVRQFEYGWLRASGSAAFIAGTLLSGWATGFFPLPSIVWISGSLLAVGGIITLYLPTVDVGRSISSAASLSALRDWVLLVKIPSFRRILLIAAFVEGSHALNDTFAVIHWRAAGVNLTTISFLWSESVLSEVVVFLLVGPPLIRRIGPAGGCALAAGAGVVRWSVLAFTSSPFILSFVQPLHGLTFALLHLACMRVIALAIPRRLAATAQSVYGTLFVGLATALLTLVSGVLYTQMGGTAFLMMAAPAVSRHGFIFASD